MESCIGCVTIVLNILPFAHYGWCARDPYTFNVLMLVSAIVTTLSSCVLICAREKRRATLTYVCTQTVELILYTIILVSIMCDYLRMRFVIGRNDLNLIGRSDLNLLLLLCMHFTLFIFAKPLLIIGSSKCVCPILVAPPDENRMAIKDDAPPSYESLGFPPKSDD
jgi:hypothetical protein